jgi:hypothetical protein
MKHLLEFEKYDQSIEEGFLSSLFGRRPDTEDARHTVKRGQGWSQYGKDTLATDPNYREDDYYVVFKGEKFYEDDIEYDDFYSTKPLPRIENGKLIIAHPGWE